MQRSRYRHAVGVGRRAQIEYVSTRIDIARDHLRDRRVDLRQRSILEVVERAQICHRPRAGRSARRGVNQSGLNNGLAKLREIAAREDVRIAEDVLRAAAGPKRTKSSPAHCTLMRSGF